MRDRPTARNLVQLVAIIGVVIAVVVWLYMWLNRGVTDERELDGGGDPAYPAQPEVVAYPDEVTVYEDLGTMTASSDLVVKGTVLSADPGREQEFDDRAGPVAQRNVLVRVESVVYNSTEGEVPNQIVVIEGWWQDGNGFARDGMPWTQPGDVGYFYLEAERGNPPAGPYSYISSAGRVLIDAQQVRPSGDREGGPWHLLTATTTEDVLDRMIIEAAAAALEGRAEPVPDARTYDTERSIR